MRTHGWQAIVLVTAFAVLCMLAGGCGGSGSTATHVSSLADPDDQVTTSSGVKTTPPPDEAKLHGEDPDDEEGVTNTANSAASEAAAANAYKKVDKDKDNDIYAPYDDSNNDAAFHFGEAAGATELHTITALVKHYYAIALAGKGAKACTMLYSPLAEAAAEDYGQPGGPAYSRGAKTCQAVLSDVFHHYHAQLAAEVPKLAVSTVRLQGRRGYAMLKFGHFAERELAVEREGSTWRLAAFMDNELP
jgi:hypothetical protein